MRLFIIPICLLLLLNVSITSCSSSNDDASEIETTDDSGDGDDSGTTDDSGMTDEDLAAVFMEDVSYGANAQQVYDLYLPEGRSASKTKVILLVHGGGWTAGDKADMAGFVSLIQETFPDHAIVNLNYTLAVIPNIPAFPNQYNDLQRAINKLIAEKDELAILPEFGMIGTSAGAHLSMMYDYTYDENDQIKFVANIVGPSDFTDPFYAEDPNFELALQFFVDQSAYPDGTNYAVVNSPARVVTNTSSPTLLFYGNEDPLVPLTNGQRLDTALNNADIEHSFTVYDGGHGDDWSQASYADLTIKLSQYIRTYLPIQ
ncbi:alpha/beta hydrolase [Dokdonia sinensis]|uniref:Alpha/beta hydrolase n=1 Tax=Dokdonia sinensis TaxID=2479847 RepID=A0A3M0GH99_9FLAO|nr:alpha/beta hydrolase [Dokdonia sinensis]RMB64040.1 alpha/beta hydrolase [Dokdonia sinensis]